MGQWPNLRCVACRTALRLSRRRTKCVEPHSVRQRSAIKLLICRKRRKADHKTQLRHTKVDERAARNRCSVHSFPNLHSGSVRDPSGRRFLWAAEPARARYHSARMRPPVPARGRCFPGCGRLRFLTLCDAQIQYEPGRLRVQDRGLSNRCKAASVCVK